MSKSDVYVNLMVKADITEAKKRMEELQKTLDELGKKASSQQGFGTGFQKQMQESQRSVAALKTALEAATKVDIRKMDFAKFNQQLKLAGTSVQEVQRNLHAMGAEGQQALLSLNQSLIKSEVPMLRIGQGLKSLGQSMVNTFRWQVSSTVLHGLMSAVQGAYGYAKDLNESLNNIRIVTGQSTEAMAQFAEEANKAAQALGTTTTQYTDAALIYYQQGIRNKEEIEERTNATIKLANVTKSSAQEVSSQLTAIWNNFAKEGDNLELYADKITALGAATASSSAEIAQGLEKFAAIADTINLSYDYATAGLATVVAQTRQSADIVGTAFKTIFGRMESLKLGKDLEDDTTLKDYSKALQQVGVEVKDANGDLRDMDDVLDDLGAKWDELNKAQKVALAQTVAGVRQYNQFIALLDNWDIVQQNVDVARNAEGTLQKQQNIYAESWEAASKRVKAAWEGVVSTVLEDKTFIGLTNGLAEFLKVIGQITKNMGGLKGIMVQIAPILTTLYSDKILQRMNDYALTLQTITKRGRENLMQERQTAMIEGAKLAEKAGGVSGVVEYNYQTKYAEIEEKLTDEEKRRVQILHDINMAQAKSVEEKQAELETAKQLNIEEREKSKLNLEDVNKAQIMGNIKAGSNFISKTDVADADSISSTTGLLTQLFSLTNSNGTTMLTAGVEGGGFYNAGGGPGTANQVENAFTSLQTATNKYQDAVANENPELANELAEKLKVEFEAFVHVYNSAIARTTSEANKQAEKEIENLTKDLEVGEEELEKIKTDLGKLKSQAIIASLTVKPEERDKIIATLKAYGNYQEAVEKGELDPRSHTLTEIHTHPTKEAFKNLGDPNFITPPTESGGGNNGSASAVAKYLKSQGIDVKGMSSGALRNLVTELEQSNGISSKEELDKQVKVKEDELHVQEQINNKTKEQIQDVQETSQNLETQSQKEGEIAEKIAEQNNEVRNVKKNAEDTSRVMDDINNRAPSMSESIFAASRVMMAFNSTLSTIKNTYKTLSDENASFGEKAGAIFQGLITLGMQWSMVVRSGVVATLKRSLTVDENTASEWANAIATDKAAKAAKKKAGAKDEETRANNVNTGSNNVNSESELKNKPKLGKKLWDPKGVTTSTGETVGGTTALGSVLFQLAMVYAAVKTFEGVFYLLDSNIRETNKKLQHENEEIQKQFEENKAPLEAASAYKTLDNQLKNNTLTVDEYREALVNSAKEMNIYNAELLGEAGAYELLALSSKKRQEELEKEADEKAYQMGQNAKTLMTAGDQGLFNNIGGFMGWYNGDFNNRSSSFKTLGAGLDVDASEKALLQELAALKIQGVTVTGRDIIWDESMMTTDSLARLAEFLAKAQANKEAYGGDSNEIIAGIDRLNENMTSVAEQLRTAADRENYRNAEKTIEAYGGQKFFDENGLTGFNAMQTVFEKMGLSVEDINKILHQYFKDGEEEKFAVLREFTEITDNKDKFTEQSKVYDNLSEKQQENFNKAAQNAPTLLDNYLKGIDGTLEEKMGDVQFILDNLSLNNFEKAFTTVQETLDNLKLGQIFENEKALENFAQKFGKDIDEFKKAYGDNFVSYADGSYAFFGDVQKMQKQYEDDLIKRIDAQAGKLEENEKALNELVGSQGYTKQVEEQGKALKEAEKNIEEKSAKRAGYGNLLGNYFRVLDHDGGGGESDLQIANLISQTSTPAALGGVLTNLGISEEDAGLIASSIVGPGTDAAAKASAYSILTDVQGKSKVLMRSLVCSAYGTDPENLPPPFDELPWIPIENGDAWVALTLEDFNALRNKVRRAFNENDFTKDEEKYNKATSNLSKAAVLKENYDLSAKAGNFSAEDIINAHMDIDTLQDKYNQYGGDIDAQNGALRAIASRNTAEDLGIKTEDLDAYVEYLQEIYPALKDDAGAAYELALANERLNKGVQDLHDNFDTWYKAIDKEKKGTEDYAKAMNGFEKALQNIFSTNDEISDNFIGKHLTDIEKAAKGDSKAINKLKVDYSKFQQESAQYNDTEGGGISKGLKAAGEAADTTYKNVNDLWDALYKVKWDDIEMNANLDSQPALKALKEFIIASKMSADQANDILNSIGFTAHLITEEGPDGNQYVVGIKSDAYVGKANKPTEKKSKSKGKSRSKKDLKDLDDEFERYYTINRQIKDQEDLLNRLGKAKDRAWGNAKLQNIDKETKALKQQIGLYEKKQKEIEKYYKQDQRRMNYFGAQYDDNGVITNYKQMQTREVNRYNAAVKKYNKGQMSEKEFHKAEERYKEYEKALKQYDDTNQLYQENLEKLRDLRNEYFDKKLEKIETKVEMDIQVDDHELKLLDYELDRIKKKAFSTAEAISKMAEEIDINLDKAASYKGGINSTLKLYGLKPGDLDNLSDKKIAKLGLTQQTVDDLMNYTDELLEAQKAIDELEESILNGPLETMQEWNEEFDYQEQKIENNINLLKQYQNIAELIYSNSSSVTNNLITELMESQYEQSVSGVAAAHAELEANKKALADARAQYEASLTDSTKTQQNRDQLKKNLREMEEIVEKSQQDLYKKTEDTLKKARELFERAIKDAGDAFKEMVKATDWDVTKFDHLKELDKQYLDDYEKIYHLSKLTRDINNSIDDADTIRQKERLKEITQEIADIEESGREVSQYEVDALRKKYELRLAEIALEDAQAAKQTVRMSRDNDGNWSYVYTADDENVDKMRQNYEDKLYEYQKLNSDFIKQQEEDFLKLQRDYVEAREKILTDSTLKDDERQAYLNEVDDFYNRMTQISSSQLGIAINKNSELYHKDWLDYSKNTDYKISKLEDYQSSIRFTYDGVLQPTIEDANQLLSQFDEAVNGENGYITKTNKALDDLKTKNKQVIEAAGADLDSFGKTVQQTMKDTEKSTKSAATEVEKDATKMEKAFEKVIAAVEKLNGKKLDKLRQQNTKLIEDIDKLIRKYKELGQAANDANKTPKTSGKDKYGSTPYYGKDDTGDTTKTKVKNQEDLPGGKEDITQNVIDWIKEVQQYAYFVSNGVGMNNFMKSLGIDSKQSVDKMIQAFQKLDPTTTGKKVAKDKTLLKQLKSQAKWIQKNKNGADGLSISFDTGGYTGSWGSEGRLAMLHQKELVLNAHDTENMLNTIQMVRDIVASIDVRAAAAGAVNINNAYASAATVGPQSFDQNVHIEANFPNATDHNEIELALSSLVNRASQYVGRKKL